MKLAVCALSYAVLLAACQRQSPIVVASKTGPEQALLGEIVAQHLENRLPGIRIQRRLAAGDSLILFQAAAGGEITIYPEATGAIATSILKEQPSPDPDVLLERTRTELARVAQLDVLDPLGFADSPAVVITANSAAPEVTLSAAARGEPRWRLAVTSEFAQDNVNFPGLNSYHLPFAAPMQTLDDAQLFTAMDQGQVNMAVTTINDGNLTTPRWKVLQDDKKVFIPEQVCLLARQDRLTDQPGLRAALGELSGKLTPDVMRKLNRQIEIEHADPPSVARAFLASVGLR